MGKAGLVLGIAGLAFCIWGYISITRPLPLLLLGPLGVTIGILLSVVGFYEARRARKIPEDPYCRIGDRRSRTRSLPMGYCGNTALVGWLGELAQVLGDLKPLTNLEPHRTIHDSPNAMDAGRTTGAVARGRRVTD